MNAWAGGNEGRVYTDLHARSWACWSLLFQSAFSSYLGYPRINFHGHFRADSNTHNNDICNYRDAPISEDRYIDWNSEGTNEFEFVNAKVTSVINEAGVPVDDPSLDPIVGRSIIGNLEGPLAKLSDRTTRNPEIFTVFGMQFGIKWADETKFPDKDRGEIAFHGVMARYVITQNMWSRIPCYSRDNHGENPYQGSIRASTQFMSTVKVDYWGDMHPPNRTYKKSVVLEELKRVSNGKKLSVRVSLFYTTRRYLPYVPYNASLGYMVGSIGVHDTYVPESAQTGVTYDTANIPGKRGLFWSKDLDKPKNLKFNKDDDICKPLSPDDIEKQKWVNFAPFEVFEKGNAEYEVRLDLSNSIPTDLQNSLRDIGRLQLAIIRQDCVELIGKELNYTSEYKLYKMSGIHKITVETSENLANVSLGLVQVGKFGENDTNELCLSRGGSKKAQILLREPSYLIRPMNYYIDSMEKGHETTSKQVVYVTRYGKPVTAGVKVTANYSKQGDSGPPKNGVTPTTDTACTNKYGVAEFTFQRNTSVNIPMRRQYYNPPACLKNSGYTLPIDGQLNHFIYCVEDICNNDIISFFLAFGDFTPPATPNWVDHVYPILAQYAQLSPMMTKILNMANFTEVLKGKELMKMSLGISNLDDPNYMPTTRDLSEEKREMILQWLDKPKFDATNSTTKPDPGVPECLEMRRPTRVSSLKLDRFCNIEMDFGNESEHHKYLVEDHRQFISLLDNNATCAQPENSQDAPGLDLESCTVLTDWEEELFAYLKAYVEHECTVDGLKAKLQDAVYLEWSTIPVYLTSLYSIIEGCNSEIYELIESIVREEMLHMTQIGNTLIAMDVTPKVDDDNVSKSIFEKNRLPGGVLPKLEVSLEKLSLEHVRRVFMTIEVPHDRTSKDRHTIGWFYHQIDACIGELQDAGKLKDSDFQHRTGMQVKWPRADGEVKEVSSIQTARDGIDMIIRQGEGAGFVEEKHVEDGTVSHFYKFEEIVCQKRLKKVGKDKYSYTGNDLPFNENGVWPMRPNPIIGSIPKDSNCYTESRAFHNVYRMLLRKLQDLFNGDAQEKDLNISIQLMKSLQAHAQKLMWTKKKPDCTAACETCEECGGCTHACEKCDACEACGPVWEYDWPTTA